MFCAGLLFYCTSQFWPCALFRLLFAMIAIEIAMTAEVQIEHLVHIASHDNWSTGVAMNEAYALFMCQW